MTGSHERWIRRSAGRPAVLVHPLKVATRVRISLGLLLLRGVFGAFAKACRCRCAKSQALQHGRRSSFDAAVTSGDGSRVRLGQEISRSLQVVRATAFGEQAPSPEIGPNAEMHSAGAIAPFRGLRKETLGFVVAAERARKTTEVVTYWTLGRHPTRGNLIGPWSE